MNCIDMNAWYSRVDKPDRPDYVVFDLDLPESRNGFAQAIKVAHLVREALLELLQLCLYREDEAERTASTCSFRSARRSTVPGHPYELAELVSRGALQQEHPGLVTTEWLKRKRRGVLVDHRQNGHGKMYRSRVLGATQAWRSGSTTRSPLGGAGRGEAPGTSAYVRRSSASNDTATCSSRRYGEDSRSAQRSGSYVRSPASA